MDTVIELAKHAEEIGADYIVVHAPVLHFLKSRTRRSTNITGRSPRRSISASPCGATPTSGYLISPELCNRIAEIPNIVAIKYSVPRADVCGADPARRRQASVSTASEEEWLDNIVELGWQALSLLLAALPDPDRMICACANIPTSPCAARYARAPASATAWSPVREALRRTRPAEKPQAHQKYWQELLGQAGGTGPAAAAAADRGREGRDARGFRELRA